MLGAFQSGLGLTPWVNQQEQRRDPRNGFPGEGKRTELPASGVLVPSDFGVLFSSLFVLL